jgi:hypothetical protein
MPLECKAGRLASVKGQNDINLPHPNACGPKRWWLRAGQQRTMTKLYAPGCCRTHVPGPKPLLLLYG